MARNADANSLALSFRDVDAIWQRLARRVNRIAKGRTGPNIQQVGKIGETSEVIHRALGLPGYAPVLGPTERRTGRVDRGFESRAEMESFRR